MKTGDDEVRARPDGSGDVLVPVVRERHRPQFPARLRVETHDGTVGHHRDLFAARDVEDDERRLPCLFIVSLRATRSLFEFSSVLAYFALLNTLPFFITKFTCLSVEIWSSGLSGVAMMSAN